MDIYRFFNAKDVADHLREIGYEFSAPEAAFIVYRSNDAMLDERIAAWQEIAEAMPDCSMEGRLNMDPIPSFRAFLRDYIDLQSKLARSLLARIVAQHDLTGAVQLRSFLEDSKYDSPSETDFDTWHENAMDGAQGKANQLAYGQIQKLINMAFSWRFKIIESLPSWSQLPNPKAPFFRDEPWQVLVNDARALLQKPVAR